MDNNFKDDELLLRAIFPPKKKPHFWGKHGITSAALKDKRGLSVSRTFDRSLEESTEQMRKDFEGSIVFVSYADCREVGAHVIYCPTRRNRYHSEIHGSPSEVELDDRQALLLSRRAIFAYKSEE